MKGQVKQACFEMYDPSVCMNETTPFFDELWIFAKENRFAVFWCIVFPDLGNMDNDVKAAFDAGNNFQQKLNDTLLGLISANNDRKSEIDALRGDHEELKKNHEAFVVTAERENDLRKNEIKSLEERTQKDNQVNTFAQ